MFSVLVHRRQFLKNKNYFQTSGMNVLFRMHALTYNVARECMDRKGQLDCRELRECRGSLVPIQVLLRTR
jgi:hypothetical protein